MAELMDAAKMAQLRAFKALWDEGVLTEREFNDQKALLLQKKRPAPPPASPTAPQRQKLRGYADCLVSDQGTYDARAVLTGYEGTFDAALEAWVFRRAPAESKVCELPRGPRAPAAARSGVAPDESAAAGGDGDGAAADGVETATASSPPGALDVGGARFEASSLAGVLRTLDDLVRDLTGDTSDTIDPALQPAAAP